MNITMLVPSIEAYEDGKIFRDEPQRHRDAEEL
jgi:hypothetical protein